MELFKKILLRFIVFGLLMILFSVIYSNYYHEKDLLQHASIIKRIRTISPECNILYLAESSNASFPPYDIDKRRISEMANDFYPNLHICHIDQGAYHAGNYRYILENIPENTSIETLVVTMNYRSFGQGWIYSSLETSLQKQMIFLHKKRPPFFNRLILAFRAYPIKTEKEWLDLMRKKWKKDKLSFPHQFPYNNVNDWDKNKWNQGVPDSNGTKDKFKSELACHYIKNFAFHIDVNNNVRVKDFDAIVDIAKERNWNLVFNLLAENMVQAKELVEPELQWLMKQNRDILINRYAKQGIIVVDNLCDVNDSLFYERNWPTEHYSETGRKIVSKNLADSLKRIYPKEYSVLY